MKTADEIANENRQAEEFLADQRKSSASSQPSFAERVARFEAWAQEDEYKLNRVVELVPDLLACIREQQAALQAIIDLDDGDQPDLWHFETEFDAARAVLARWSLK